MGSANRWPEATRDHPCPKCGKPDRCTIAPDERAGHCFRNGETWRDGNGRANGNGHVRVPRRSKPQPTTPALNEHDWKAEAERLRGAMTDERLAALADATGVPVTAWGLLSPGWATADDLRAMRAGGAGWKDDPPDGAYVFAEHGGDGRVVGLSLRTMDGRKGSPSGAKRGLIVPADLHQRPDPVLIVEGASDVAACSALGLAAVGRPSNRAGAADAAVMLDGRAVLVVGERDGKPDGSWPGRDGAKAVAGQIAGRWKESVRWTLPPIKTKDLREWLRDKTASGLDLKDSDALRGAGVELLAALEQAAKEAKPEKRTQADALVDLALRHYRLGLSSDGEAFAVPLEGPNIALMFRGGGVGLRSVLAKSYRQVTGRTPSSSALADALVSLEGLAQDAQREPVALRAAEHDGAIVLDLGDASGRVVVVTSGGWAVEAVSPVLFRRTALTGALPEPVTSAANSAADALALNELRELLNVDDESWPLVVGYLVATLIPGIPHAVLMFGGEQGTGKSMAARLLVGLTDPSPAPLRTQPTQPRQWVISAAGSLVVALDNVSHIPDWLSDAICKAATGDGWIDRKLYTDAELAVLNFRRCVIITSIDPGAMRGDLGDRLLLVDLEPIPDDKRRTEADIFAAFEQMRPRLLGALLSALSRTLAALPDVCLKTMPRMADFARVLAALDAACPELTGGKALGLFAGQRQRIARDVVESDAVALAVAGLMESQNSWMGTASELLEALTPEHPPKGWPQNARALVGRLRRVRPALGQTGICHIPPATTDKTRMHRIEKTAKLPPEPPEDGNSNPGRGLRGELEAGCGSEPPAQPPDDRPSASAHGGAPEASAGGVGGLGGTGPITSNNCDDGRERGEL